jgi:hypothetical protein
MLVSPRILRLLAAALLASAVGSAARAEETVFLFDTGKPPWRGERLVLPPGFARNLGWSGVEEIRFSPGMFDATAEDFFSYLLVFHLAPGSDVSEEGLEREFLVYYRGLSEAVMGGKGKSVETSGFAISLTKPESEEDKARTAPPLAAPEAGAWTGTLDWTEPFATEKPQRLHLEVHVWNKGGNPVVLSCVSPLAPSGEVAWPALRKARAAFRFGP